MPLIIKDLHVTVENKEIIKGLTLTINKGEIHALMGPNGAGKSTLSQALLGHPKYTITKGTATLDGKDILAMKTDERARAGLFLAFQYPQEIPGITLNHFLYTITRANRTITPLQFRQEIITHLETLKLDKTVLERQLNVGFSGGEKKRAEILQLLNLRSPYAILDETDSGLDIDSLAIVAKALKQVTEQTGMLVITHYTRILKHLKPTHVHILRDGVIVRSGDGTLADEIEKTGYAVMNETNPETCTQDTTI